ncbi:MAG TPA: His/Gly/Thr/Pro-type tRNA ligase C-terminal domain-containing protein, partial [Thermoleophilia bacterium]|nr:His/Gly/Thr/Pro-type tRNA ligase C-terminal domain-containing protein [Thermoleophilia bacterium]
SIERFMGILLEHYGGNLPTWLAPVQVLVLPIADRHAAYAREVEAAFAAAEADGRARTPVWVEVDDSSESLGKRIREGQVQKVPYILVVGDREQRERTVSVRERGADKGAAPLERVVADILDEISERRLPAA